MSDSREPAKGITRRRVIVGAAATASAVALAKLLHWSYRRPPREAVKRSAVHAPVAVVPCESYRPEALREALEQGFLLAPPPDVRGKRVLLKPNFVEYSPDRPVTTHVELIRQAARSFRERGAAEVVIGEGPGHNPDTDEVWTRSGLFRMAADEGARVVDLNVDDMVRTHMRTFPEAKGFEGRALEYLFLPKTVLAADVIVSMPKLKTHHWAGFTLGMKNLFGFVPSAKYGWPKNILHVNGIVRSVVELAGSIPVAYTITDGIEGMEGDGPIMGTSVPSHCILCGPSVYSVDWAGARIMGLDPTKLDVLRLASAAGFGPLEDPPVVGESLDRVRRPFVIPPRFDSLRA